MKIVEFNRWKCRVYKVSYATNGRTALQLLDIADGSRIATATVNIPEVELDDDEVIIKDYSENKGILEALIQAEIIEKPIRELKLGFVTVYVCKLLI